MKIASHTFWPSSDKKRCSFCGKELNDPIHVLKAEERDPATQIAYDLYPSSARPVNPSGQ